VVGFLGNIFEGRNSVTPIAVTKYFIRGFNDVMPLQVGEADIVFFTFFDSTVIQFIG
jgi:hypothetical protein